jgi:hypothetical protein
MIYTNMENNAELVSLETDLLFCVNQEIRTLNVRCHWSCDACGGDSETGCLMSDPDNCVRG